jgi:REP element-mobilizing transposase RayT
MGRLPRPLFAGGYYHVTTRGNRHLPIFLDGFDHARFERLLTRIVNALEWRCHSFCFMPNHYHLVIETRHPNIAVGMQRLNGVYAKSFNWAHSFEGHVFERRYRSIVVETDAHMLELSRYLPLNPVRAGLCRHPSEWPWSSYRAMVGLEPPPEFLTCDWLLSLFGPDLERARTNFAAFVDGVLAAA